MLSRSTGWMKRMDQSLSWEGKMHVSRNTSTLSLRLRKVAWGASQTHRIWPTCLCCALALSGPVMTPGSSQIRTFGCLLHREGHHKEVWSSSFGFSSSFSSSSYSFSFYPLLKIEFRDLWMWDKHSTTELHLRTGSFSYELWASLSLTPEKCMPSRHTTGRTPVPSPLSQPKCWMPGTLKVSV